MKMFFLKSIASLILLCCMGITELNAQTVKSNDDASVVSQNFPYSIGLYVMAGGGINTVNTPNGIKNGVVYTGSPDIGLTSYIPISDQNKVGIVVDLGYTSFGWDQKYNDNENVRWPYYVHYLTLGPTLDIYGFNIGFNFGLPLSGKIDYSLRKQPDVEIKSDIMNTLVELRIGGIIPIIANENGRLNLNIEGGYVLSGVFNKYSYGDAYNPQPAKLTLGLSYLFNLK